MSLRTYHERNWPDAELFLDVLIVVAGAGTTGSLFGESVATKGFKLRLLDRDQLEVPNLHRHAAKRRFTSRPKAEATALSLREELPPEQVVSFAQIDLVEAPVRELASLLIDADIVVGATGSRAVDLHLNTFCRALKVPYLSIALWPEGQALGHVHLSSWGNGGHAYGERLMSCVSCSGAGNDGQAEAQRGAREDIQPVVALAVRIVSAMCLPEVDPRSRWLATFLERGQNFFIVRGADHCIVGVNTEDAVRAECPEGDAELRTALRRRHRRREDDLLFRRVVAVLMTAIFAAVVLVAIAR